VPAVRVRSTTRRGAAPGSVAGRIACVAAVLAVIVLALAEPAGARSMMERRLTVFAAASLGEAFTEIGRDFERSHPGARVTFNLAGSQVLANQIVLGARADVFASADMRWMEHVREAKLLAGAPEPFAGNRLVVIVPRRNRARIARLEDLARPGVKLVAGAPAVPVGAYTRAAIGKLARLPGFPAGYEARVLANLVSHEENVRAVVGKVQLGEADAGFVYRSDVGKAARAVKTIPLPDEGNVLALYPIAALAKASDARLAREFVERVRSEAGQRVLARHGFLPVLALGR
jgi:molybdate transport system substrate-binding protein